MDKTTVWHDWLSGTKEAEKADSSQEMEKVRPTQDSFSSFNEHDHRDRMAKTTDCLHAKLAIILSKSFAFSD